MAGLPVNFQSVSPVLSNYDFVDIASGTGYINLYAGSSVDLKMLSNYQYYSDSIYTTASGNTLAYSKIIDLDFDVILNRPLDTRGITVCNIPIRIVSTFNNAQYWKIVATLNKVSGGVETEIITNEKEIYGTIIDKYIMTGIDLNIPLTHFKIGDTVRLTIEGWVKTNVANSMSLYIAYDPMNRTTDGTLTWDATGAVPSRLVFQCPVRLNI